MNDEERQDRLSKALAAAEGSNLQPAVVVRAFLDPEPPEVFGITLPQVTLRAWLRLEAARSPFVTGAHSEDATERLQALCTAVEVISGEPLFPESLIGSVPVEEVLGAELTVARRVNECFDTFLPLRNPDVKDAPKLRPAGTGWWVKIVAKLAAAFGCSINEALETPLIQAFALLAAHGTNEGHEPDGITWAEREAVEAASAESEVPA